MTCMSLETLVINRRLKSKEAKCIIDIEGKYIRILGRIDDPDDDDDEIDEFGIKEQKEEELSHIERLEKENILPKQKYNRNIEITIPLQQVSGVHFEFQPDLNAPKSSNSMVCMYILLNNMIYSLSLSLSIVTIILYHISFHTQYCSGAYHQNSLGDLYSSELHHYLHAYIHSFFLHLSLNLSFHFLLFRFIYDSCLEISWDESQR